VRLRLIFRFGFSIFRFRPSASMSTSGDRVVATAPPPATRNTSQARPKITARTLRQDRWWLQPLITFTVLVLFIIYSTFRAFWGKHFYSEPLISPFYSPCLSSACGEALKHGNHGVPPYLSWLPTTRYVFTPAIWILIFPLGFRMTCYYYRKAYYRSFWASPPACAVAEPHKKYTGETRPPLIANNLHRYFFYAGLVFNAILTYDAVMSFKDNSGHWGHVSLGTLVLLVNASLLWLYSASCHSCRHVMGGKLRNFSKHPVRYKAWGYVSKLNHHHMKFAWASLVFVALTDGYVWCVAASAFHNPVFF
jgi:hypothetical protein